MAFQIQIRRDTAANWTSVDPTMAQGEMGYETDTGQFKIGDGATAWTSLPYIYGEVNTASNVGTAGVGVFKQKTALDLEFKKLNAGSGKVTVTDDGVNSEVDIDVVPAQISHNDLGSIPGSSDGYHLSSTISGYVNNLTSDAQSQLNAKEPTLPLSTRGDVLVRDASNNTARLAVGAAGTVLSSDGTDVSWQVASGGASFDRMEIVTTGGSSAVNTAISTINAAGGGKVMLDGMIDIDGDITMMAGVTLIGNGPGTGLQNTTANAYAINFVGSTPTWYTTSYYYVAVSLTTSTAADAGNFSVDDYILAKYDTVTNRGTGWHTARADGVAGTGVVALWQRQNDSCQAGTQIANLTTAGMLKAGLDGLTLKNTSTGSLTVVIQYAVETEIKNGYHENVSITVDNSILTEIVNNTFTATDGAAFSQHIGLSSWTNETHILRNRFHNATYAVKQLVNSTSHFGLQFRQNYVTTYWGIYLTTTHTTRKDWLAWYDISNNSFNCGPNSTGTIGQTCIYINFISRRGQINSNYATGYTEGVNLANGSGLLHYYVECVGNNFLMACTFNSQYYGVFSSNEVEGACAFRHGCYECTISGNQVNAVYLSANSTYKVYRTAFVGNKVRGAANLGGESATAFEGNVFSGNIIQATTTLSTYAIDSVFTGNVFCGNVTITASASETADRIIFSNNNVDGTVTFTEANQDYCVITGNTTNGAITDLTAGGGTGNIQANNTEY